MIYEIVKLHNYKQTLNLFELTEFVTMSKNVLKKLTTFVKK